MLSEKEEMLIKDKKRIPDELGNKFKLSISLNEKKRILVDIKAT
jgi:hypothetical protein